MMIGWGLMAGVAALYLGERIPQIRADFFSRIPLLGSSIISFYFLSGERYKIPCTSNGNGKSNSDDSEDNSEIRDEQ
jgi:hypothetical protein